MTRLGCESSQQEEGASAFWVLRWQPANKKQAAKANSTVRFIGDSLLRTLRFVTPAQARGRIRRKTWIAALAGMTDCSVYSSITNNTGFRLCLAEV
jgi:hypothetical protein